MRVLRKMISENGLLPIQTQPKRTDFEASTFIFLNTIFHQASRHLKLVAEIH